MRCARLRSDSDLGDTAKLPMAGEKRQEFDGCAAKKSRYYQVRDASIRGTGAGIVAMLGQACLRFGAVAMLARLLSPEDFGVVAMCGILLNLVTLIGDWGLTAASTQRLNLSHDQLAKLFWINSLLGLALAAASALCAPLLALLFAETRVVGATLALSVSVVAIGVGAQHEALMRRQLRYRTLQLVRLGAHAFGVCVAVAVALAGGRFWALVAMQVAMQIARTGLNWIISGWTPRLPKKSVKVSSVLRFGNNLVPSTILFYLSRNAAPTLLGAVAGAADLGLYNRAAVSVMTPLAYLVEPLERVVPASLSRLQRNKDAFNRLFAQTLTVTAFAGCGALVLVAVEAPALVWVLLGPQWEAAIPLVRWLTLAGATWMVGKLVGWLLVPRGHAGRLMVIRLMRCVTSVAGVIVGWNWGPVGVAAGYGIATAVSLVGEILYLGPVLSLAGRAVLQSIWRPCVAALLAAALVLAIPAADGIWWTALNVVLYVGTLLASNALLPGGVRFMRDLRRAITIATVAARSHQHAPRKTAGSNSGRGR